MNGRPKKHFGQHFLTDQNIIEKIVDYFQPQPEQLICEIGPGKGALTDSLLKKVPHIHAVEIDRDLGAELRQRYDEERLSLHMADVLQFSITSLSESPASLRLIGNLPYNISTPLLFHLLADRRLIIDMLFMLQRDVVERIVAPPGNKVYGRLSVMLQAYCKVQCIFHIAPTCFFPPPKVESSIIQIQPLSNSGIRDDTLFAQIVKNAFGQRRKTIRNCLKNLANDTDLQQAGIDPALRAENINVKQFIILANNLSN